MNIEKHKSLGKALEEILLLRYSPIALKLLYVGDKIPDDSFRPFRDKGDRLSMCQAAALVRRNRQAVTMLKEDHWCVWPLVSYRMVDLDEDDYEYMGTKFFMSDAERSKKYLREEYPVLKTEKPVMGFTMAPLRSVNFEPDLVLIYCRPAQLRSIMMAAKFFSGEMIKVSLDPVDSCVHSTIPVLNGQDYNVTIPDPGEYERAMTDEDEVMFTIKSEKTEELVNGLRILSASNFGYQEMTMDMPTNFPRPEFYNVMFEKWGLGSGKVWNK